MPYLQSLRVESTCICFNGGWIGNPLTGESMRDKRLSLEAAQDVFALAERLGVTALWYAGDEVFSTTDTEVVRRETAITGELLRFSASSREFSTPPNKIMCVASEQAGQAKFQIIREAFGEQLQFSRSHARLLEISPLGVDKADAASVLREAIGIPAHETAAAGDAENDLRMLADAGFPVTVSNAIPSIRELAMFTAPSCDDGGMADAVNWLLSIRRNDSNEQGLTHA